MRRRKDPMHHRPRRTRTREEYLGSLAWNIKDATEALHNAIAMRRWATARKYIGQLERLDRLQFVAETRTASGRHARRVERRGLGFAHYGHSAGATFGRGRLP